MAGFKTDHGHATEIPMRLVPYLEDMVRGGLWGKDLDEVIVRCVERQIGQEVTAGLIPLRRLGRIIRWLVPSRRR